MAETPGGSSTVNRAAGNVGRLETRHLRNYKIYDGTPASFDAVCADRF